MKSYNFKFIGAEYKKVELPPSEKRKKILVNWHLIKIRMVGFSKFRAS